MCMRCDGYSWEEIDRHHDLVIRVHGYLIQQVDDVKPWTYTVGITESWGRPELLMVDVEPEVQAMLIKAVADDHIDHGDVRPSTLDLLDVELVVVDERHFRNGMVATWEDRYSRSATTGDFLQVVPGPGWFCEHHAARVRRLV